jgi:hypothetical protein
MPRILQSTHRAGRLTGIVLLVGVAAFAAAVLLGEPCRGVADNGDFFRVTRPAGIEPLEPQPRRPGLFVQCSYAVGSADLGELFTSAALFAWAAKHVPFPATPGTMALQQMGTLWLALWLLLVAALVRAGAPLPGLVAVFVVLADPGYLLFWNSFYGDAALLFALAGSVALLSHWAAEPTRLARPPRGRLLAWSAVLVALGFVGSWSKMQYLLFATVLALALAPLLVGPPAARRRLAGAALALLLVAVAAGWHFVLGGGPRFPWANNYHAVFAGIAQVAAEPDEALAAVGVPERFRDLPRRDVFGRVAPDHPVHAELADLSRLRLLGLYAGDPQALAGVASRVQAEMARLRTHTRGNHPRTAERPRRTVDDPPWRFGRVRHRLLGPRPWLLWPLLALTTLACAAAPFRGAPAAARTAPFLLLLLWFSSQVVAVVLGDGFVAFEQHLVGARLALDLLLALGLVELGRLGLQLIGRGRRRSRELRGAPDGAPAAAAG